jgi:rhodanese-related sulfurtransferase
MLSLIPILMRSSFARLTALVLLAGALLANVHAQEKPLPPVIPLPPVAKEVTAADAAALVQTKRVNILDLRTATEVKEQGRIAGSKHLDFFRDDFGPVLMEQVKMDPASPCLIYCALGGRARHAAQRLADLGFKEVLVLKDGYNAWKQAGLPVEALK